MIPTTKLKITVTEILDYIHCPLMYKFKYIDKLDVTVNSAGTLNHRILYVKYDRDLHRMAYRLFYGIQEGLFPGAWHMKQRWGHFWVKDRSKEDLLYFTEAWTDKRRKLERQGVEVILKMMKKYRDNPGIPIMIGAQYEVELGKYLLCGEIEVVRVVTDGGQEHTEIIDFKVNERTKILGAYIHRDLNLTAASYAFRKKLQTKESRLVYHDLVSGEIHYTKREKKDFEVLWKTVDGVYKSIHSKLFYPVLDTRCYKCPYTIYCSGKEWC